MLSNAQTAKMTNQHKVFLSNNAAFAENFTDGELALPPSKKTLVLACMDARLHVEKVLGIKNGKRMYGEAARVSLHKPGTHNP